MFFRGGEGAENAGIATTTKKFNEIATPSRIRIDDGLSINKYRYIHIHVNISSPESTSKYRLLLFPIKLRALAHKKIICHALGSVFHNIVQDCRAPCGNLYYPLRARPKPIIQRNRCHIRGPASMACCWQRWRRFPYRAVDCGQTTYNAKD